MSNESFKDKLKQKAAQDPLFKSQPLTMEQRLAKLERENLALKKDIATQQSQAQRPQNSIPARPQGPAPVGFAAKLKAKLEQANEEARAASILDGILEKTQYGEEASGPAGAAGFKKD